MQQGGQRSAPGWRRRSSAALAALLLRRRRESTTAGDSETAGAAGTSPQVDLTDAIRAIALRKSLSPEEKSRAIQALYSQQHAVSGSSSMKRGSETTEGTADSASLEDDDDQIDAPMGLNTCGHYVRGCSIVATCCGKIYPCRICHDENEDHRINRCLTKTMICRECGLKQKVAEHCRNARCDWNSTFYFCKICRLWNDDESLDIFHCKDCGLCRIGHEDEYTHCPTCALCLPNDVFGDHKCVDSQTDCLICGESMQDSRKHVALLRCGHALHMTCEIEAQRKGLRACPLCRKSFIDPNDMNVEPFREQLIRQPMPPDYRGFTAKISCNDCNEDTEAPFHFLGHICGNCNSPNTILLARYRNDEDEEEN